MYSPAQIFARSPSGIRASRGREADEHESIMACAGPGNASNTAVPGTVSVFGHGVALASRAPNDNGSTGSALTGPGIAKGWVNPADEGPIPAAADICAALPNAAEADANAGSGLSTVGVGRKASTIAWISPRTFSEAVTRRSMAHSHRDCGPSAIIESRTTAWRSDASSKFSTDAHWGGGVPNDTDGRGGESEEAAERERVWRVSESRRAVRPRPRGARPRGMLQVQEYNGNKLSNGGGNITKKHNRNDSNRTAYGNPKQIVKIYRYMYTHQHISVPRLILTKHIDTHPYTHTHTPHTNTHTELHTYDPTAGHIDVM